MTSAWQAMLPRSNTAAQNQKAVYAYFTSKYTAFRLCRAVYPMQGAQANVICDRSIIVSMATFPCPKVISRETPEVLRVNEGALYWF